MDATTPQPVPEQLAGSGVMLVDSVSGVLLPVEFELVTVTTSAMVAASHKLTYTWLLSAAAVANMRSASDAGYTVQMPRTNSPPTQHTVSKRIALPTTAIET